MSLAMFASPRCDRWDFLAEVGGSSCSSFADSTIIEPHDSEQDDKQCRCSGVELGHGRFRGSCIWDIRGERDRT